MKLASPGTRQQLEHVRRVAPKSPKGRQQLEHVGRVAAESSNRRQQLEHVRRIAAESSNRRQQVVHVGDVATRVRVTSSRAAERPTSAAMATTRAAEVGLSAIRAPTLFNELLNLYDGRTYVHLLTDSAFCMDNHRVGVTPKPCRPRRGPQQGLQRGRMRTPTAARQEWT